jgi:hypothetical protein
MRLDPHLVRTTHYCKLKRVYLRLPLHVHSAGQKGLTGTASGNRAAPEVAAGGTVRATNWNPDRLRNRQENELTSEAWKPLESVPCRDGSSIEDSLSRAAAKAS